MDVEEIIRKKGMLRGLSPRTIRTYTFAVKKFLRIYRKTPYQVSKNDIEGYLLKLLERGSSGNTVNVYLNAFKFLFEECLGRKLTVNICFTKTPQRLPEFLTKEELIHFFTCIKNKKHLLMITLLYSAGLRVSELVNLKVRDLQLNENYGWVRLGKGRKDRLFIIAKKLKEDLEIWINKNEIKPESHLFSSYNGRKMSTQTIRKIIKEATKIAGLSKNVHPHTLRHSFATHLIQNGYAVTEVQPLLGHNRIETTLIYTHLAAPKLLNTKSPYDQLNRGKLDDKLC